MTGILGLAVFTLPIHATEIQPAPKMPKVIYKGHKNKHIHILKPGAKPKDLSKQVITGAELVVPAGASELLSFRFALPNASPAEGAFGGWTAFSPDKEDDFSTTPAADNAKPVVHSDTEKRQKVSLLPGAYTAYFSMPLADSAPGESVAPLVWTQPVRVKRGKMDEFRVEIPTFSADRIAHIHLKKAGPMTPFNQLTLEPVSPDRLTSRWEYLMGDAGWPSDEFPATLLTGKYRLILNASNGGAFSTLRYEYADPITVTEGMTLPFQRPLFHTLKAQITDRKGAPLPGVPLTLHGPGETFMFLDSRSGSINVRVPEGRYTIKATLFDKNRDREVTLEKDLDLSHDQERVWKTPVTAIDFGFGQPSAPPEIRPSP
jgi:hypothetical protein